MARIRTIKPEFFRHEGLQDLEMKHPGMYIMLTFAGLWTQCDAYGVYDHRPRMLHLDILPFINFDMEATMNILLENGYIETFTKDGKTFGRIPTWAKHQTITAVEKDYTDKREAKNNPENTSAEHVQNTYSTSTEQVQNLFYRKGKGKEGEKEKEKEKEKERVLGKGRGTGEPDTRPSEVLSSFGDLETAITGRLPEMIESFGFSQFTLTNFAKEWLARKKLSGDWKKYPPGALLSFFIKDAADKLNHNLAGLPSNTC